MQSARDKLWIISELFYPDEAATSHFLSNIAFGLADQFDVRVLCFRSDSTPDLPAKEIVKGVEIQRIWMPKLDKNRLIQRILKGIWGTITLTLMAICQVSRGERCLIVTNPPIMPLLLLPFLWFKGAKIILKIDDLYPDSLIAAGVLTSKSPLFWFWRLNNWIHYKMASLIITLGRDMNQLIRSRMTRKSQDKVIVIPNWADLEEISPTSKTSTMLCKELNLEHKFVFLVAGNIGRVQGIKSILDAAQLLKDRLDVVFLFIGSGALESYLKKRVSDDGLTNVIHLSSVARSRQNEFLNCCDAAVITLEKGMFGIGIPSRFYNYLAAGKPILGIVDENSEHGLVIRQDHVGWCAVPGDAESIAGVVREAVASPHCVAMGQRARIVAETRYSRPVILNQFKKQLTGILVPNRSS